MGTSPGLAGRPPNRLTCSGCVRPTEEDGQPQAHRSDFKVAVVVPGEGADALAHGVAMVTGTAWFSVRKEPKSRGLEQFIEGFRLRTCEGNWASAQPTADAVG